MFLFDKTSIPANSIVYSLAQPYLGASQVTTHTGGSLARTIGIVGATANCEVSIQVAVINVNDLGLPLPVESDWVDFVLPSNSYLISDAVINNVFIRAKANNIGGTAVLVTAFVEGR